MARLLFIEDNEHMRRIYSEKFRSEGFIVESVPDGERGLTAARAAPPDAILLDLMLPKLSGFDVLKQLRADAALHTVPVFILSNKSWPDDVTYALSLGAKQFYAKGSHSLQEIARQLRRECGLKKIIFLSRDASGRGLFALLEHPRLLCSVSTVFAEACAVAERGAPDAIILDARAPIANATTILQQLKTAAATRSIPVMVITNQPHMFNRADDLIAPDKLANLRPALLTRLGLDAGS